MRALPLECSGPASFVATLLRARARGARSLAHAAINRRCSPPSACPPFVGSGGGSGGSERMTFCRVAPQQQRPRQAGGRCGGGPCKTARSAEKQTRPAHASAHTCSTRAHETLRAHIRRKCEQRARLDQAVSRNDDAAAYLVARSPPPSSSSSSSSSSSTSGDDLNSGAPRPSISGRERKSKAAAAKDDGGNVAHSLARRSRARTLVDRKATQESDKENARARFFFVSRLAPHFSTLGVLAIAPSLLCPLTNAHLTL